MPTTESNNDTDEQAALSTHSLTTSPERRRSISFFTQSETPFFLNSRENPQQKHLERNHIVDFFFSSEIAGDLEMSMLRICGLMGASSVGMAAYGAHGMKGASDIARTSYRNGNKLHMIHAATLLACALGREKLKYPKITFGLFLVGTIVFSGSCYVAALTGNRRLGRLAPIGGTTLIAAWLSLCV